MPLRMQDTEEDVAEQTVTLMVQRSTLEGKYDGGQGDEWEQLFVDVQVLLDAAFEEVEKQLPPGVSLSWDQDIGGS